MVKLLNALFTGTLLLLAFLIFINPQRKNTKANKWFGAFILCLFLISFQTFLQDAKLKIDNQYLEGLVSLSDFIIAPVFYLSVSYFIEPDKKWNAKDFLHFSFAIIILVLQIMSFYTSPKPDELSPETKDTVLIVFSILFGSQILTYCLLAYRKLVKYRQNITLYTSSTEKINLKWLQYISLGIVVIASLWVLDILFQLSENNKTFDFITSILYLSSAFFIAFHWFKQEELFPYNQAEITEINAIITAKEIPGDYRKKLISDHQLNSAKTELTSLMENEKPFLDGELSLVKLASQLNTSPHILSYVINTGFNENFYQYINRHRIEEAKKRITDPQMNHLSLLGIAYEVGFNSKTVFNTTFKKHTGKTPTEFKKQ